MGRKGETASAWLQLIGAVSQALQVFLNLLNLSLQGLISHLKALILSTEMLCIGLRA